MSSELKYAVFGSGSWATAIVKMLCENRDQVGWYVRSPQTVDYVLSEQHNPSYLSAVEFQVDQLYLDSDINKMADYADVLIFAIPSAFIEDELDKLNIDISSKIIVSAVKGIIPASGLLVGEHFQKKHTVDLNNVVVVVVVVVVGRGDGCGGVGRQAACGRSTSTGRWTRRRRRVSTAMRRAGSLCRCSIP